MADKTNKNILQIKMLGQTTALSHGVKGMELDPTEMGGGGYLPTTLGKTASNSIKLATFKKY